jgi:hypothetical protein
MRQTLHFLAASLLIVLSGCASKEALIDMRKDVNNPEAVKKHIEEINEILAEPNSDPLLFAEAMKTGMVLSSQGNLSSSDSTGYNKLIDNYQQIREKDMIVHASFAFGEKADLESFNAYTNDYAIYCIANAGGDRLPDETIRVLYSLSPYDKRRAVVSTLDGLKQYMGTIRSDKKRAAKTLVGLARFRDGKQLTRDESSLLASLENDLVTLENLNYIYANSHRYLKTTNQYSYVFSLNEAIYTTLLDEKQVPESYDALRANIRTLMDFSQNEDIDRVYRDHADRLLLKYSPVSYYVLMFRQKQKPTALLRLISLYKYARLEDDAAKKSDKVYYLSANEENAGRKYLNHRLIFEPEVFGNVDAEIKTYFITALGDIMKNESVANHTFYYSHMIDIMPGEFVDHLLSTYKKATNHPDLVNQFDFAMRLIEQEGKLDKKRGDALYKAALSVYAKTSPSFDATTYAHFQKSVGVYLAKNRTSAFIDTSVALLSKNRKIASHEAFTLNFLYALENKKHTLKNYEGSYKKIFAFHDEASSRYLSNYLLKKDVNYLHSLYVSGLMNNKIALWELSMIGSVSLASDKKLSAGVKESVKKKFVALVSISDDDRSVVSAHYAKALGADVSAAMNKRHRGMKL